MATHPLESSSIFTRTEEGSSSPRVLTQHALTHLRRVKTLLGFTEHEIAVDESEELETIRQTGYTPKQIKVPQ